MMLRDRLSRLSEAGLRITEDLDFDTVLQEVVDEARSLTSSRYGAITVLRNAGQKPDFIVSGLTPEEYQGLWDMPGGLRFFEYLSGLEKPLRVSNIDSHLKALNMPDFLPSVSVSSLLVTPIRHRGVGVGTIYMAHGPDGGEFTREDEETLVLFASHAAMAITNARKHREERQARADLETLVNTSPVGVVVLDAQTGSLVSANREAVRIVDGLREEDQPAEDLLEVVTFMRADGREVSLREFPLAELLSSGETIRAEEITLRGPGGHSVSTLLNATPIHSEDGVLTSFVVTLQDLTPLEEQERLRAEFLAMVSHELRTPLAAIKGSVTTLLNDAGDMDTAEMTQFHHIIRDQSEQMRYLIGDLLDVVRIETGTLPVDPEPSDLQTLVDEAVSRFLALDAGNPLEMELADDLPLVLADRRRIVQVLGNLLSNAAGYSPEGSPIQVSAARDRAHVAVAVADRGRGIPAELLPELFRRFSRVHDAVTASDVDGSGLGLAICKGIVEAHGGRIRAESDGPGMGARFTFTLPMAEVAGAAAASPFSGTRRATQRAVRVLAVDDNLQDLRYIRDVLNRAGYAPVVTSDPDDVPRLMAEHNPHMALLDMVLPGTDGIELMNEVHRRAYVPVIFLSAYGQDETVARALDMGAADYLVKPFSPTELTARIRAALRKGLDSYLGETEPSGAYAMGDLSIDYAQRQVTLAGEPVKLTDTEYAVLYQLAMQAPEVLGHSVLIQRVWGTERIGENWRLRDLVKRLRHKLGDDAANPTYIFTEQRVGYRMTTGEASDGEPIKGR